MTRYSRLGYVALNVSDIAISKTFYVEKLGLQLSGIGPSGEVFLRCSADHHNIILYQDQPVGLRRVGWHMENEAAVDTLRAMLEGHGHAVHQVPAAESDALHQSTSYRFVDPVLKLTVEFYAGVREFGSGFTPTVAKILRIGHVVIKSPNQRESVKFYTDHMGFKISDQVDGIVTFMRCFPSPFHHSLGIGAGKEPILHHVNFMVSEIDDIGIAMARFKREGIKIVWGPGRHPPSGSVFLYFLDPDGMTLEYSFGMEEFPEENPRPHRWMYPDVTSADAWASEQLPEFASTGVVVPAADIVEHA